MKDRPRQILIAAVFSVLVSMVTVFYGEQGVEAQENALPPVPPQTSTLDMPTSQPPSPPDQNVPPCPVQGGPMDAPCMQPQGSPDQNMPPFPHAFGQMGGPQRHFGPPPGPFPGVGSQFGAFQSPFAGFGGPYMPPQNPVSQPYASYGPQPGPFSGPIGGPQTRGGRHGHGPMGPMPQQKQPRGPISLDADTLFRCIDASGDGMISREEFGAVLARLCPQPMAQCPDGPPNTQPGPPPGPKPGPQPGLQQDPPPSPPPG